MTSPQKIKGSAYEREVVKALTEAGIYAERAYGAGRPDDVGDISGIPNWILECKNHAKFALSQWLAEAERERQNAKAKFGAVIIKKRGKSAKESYVLLDFETFVKILKELNAKSPANSSGN